MLSPGLRRRLDALERGYSSPHLVAIAMEAIEAGKRPTPGPAAVVAHDMAAALHAIHFRPGAFPAPLEHFTAGPGGS